MAGQRRVVYDMRGAHEALGADLKHPQIVMRQLARELNFRVMESVPQSIADAWWFWIEFDGAEDPAMPSYARIAHWLPVGTV